MEKEGLPVVATTTTISKPSKRHGLLSVFFATLSVASSNRSPAKNASPTVEKQEASGNFWKTFVCGIRPLHHQTIDHCPITPRPTKVKSMKLSPTSSIDESNNGMCSHYASAVDLQELDNDSGNEDKDVSKDDGYNAIDQQAEEFIARFYEQMRLQHLESMEHA